MTPLPFNAQPTETPITAELARIVPMAHHEEFHNRTTDEQRLRISELIKMFDFIKSSPDGVVASCMRLALEHPGRGFSAGNLKTLYYAYQIALDLFKRGWMIDGRPLADRITKMLDAIATQQKAGRLVDFWPYFQASVTRYVGSNAEELKEEAMRAGTHIQSFLYRQGKASEPSLPELIAQRADESQKAKSLRERISAQRKQAACKAAADQTQLPL